MVTNLQLFHLFRVLQWRRTLQLIDRGIAARSKYNAIQIYYCVLPLPSKPQNMLIQSRCCSTVDKCLPHVQHDFPSSFNQSDS